MADVTGSASEFVGNMMALYRLMPVAPGAIDAAAVAEMAGSTVVDAEEWLRALAKMNMVVDVGGLYVLHDGVLAHASALAPKGKKRREALVRLTTWYLTHGADAAVTIQPGWHAHPAFKTPAGAFASIPEALGWLSGRFDLLRSLAHIAYEQREYDLAVGLVEAMMPLYTLQQRFTECAVDHEIGSAAAARLGDPLKHARMLQGWAFADLCSGRYDAAIERSEQAKELAEAAQNNAAHNDTADSLVGESASLALIGKCWLAKGQLVLAAEFFSEAANVSEKAGDKRGKALMSGLIGETSAAQGNHTVALSYYNTAADWVCQKPQEAYARCRLLILQAISHLAVRDLAAAAEAAEKALELAALGFSLEFARASRVRGEVAASSRDHATALVHYERAAGYFATQPDERGSREWVTALTGISLNATGRPLDAMRTLLPLVDDRREDNSEARDRALVVLAGIASTLGDEHARRRYLAQVATAPATSALQSVGGA